MERSGTKIAFDVAVSKGQLQLQVRRRRSNVAVFSDVNPQLVAMFLFQNNAPLRVWHRDWAAEDDWADLVEANAENWPGTEGGDTLRVLV
jgi:hypothetical protein